MSPEDEGASPAGVSGYANSAESTSTPGGTLPASTSRKPLPSPLAISTTSLQPSTPSTHLSTSLSISGNSRNSIESSRSDLTSLRSDLTSFHISEFPLPPSILPAIPASPVTPKSLYFTSTPKSGTANLLQESADSTTRSILPGPKTLKGFFTRSNNSSQTRLVPEQSLPSEQPELGIPDSYHSHHSFLKGAATQLTGSRAPTPTTAGTMTPREWESDTSRRSSVVLNTSVPPNPEGLLSPVASSDLPPQPAVSPPPQFPLPVPPSNRSSIRYSQVLQQTVNLDVGDITEEKLLSTDFITEMLGQPAASASQATLPGITLQEAMSSEKRRTQGTDLIQPFTPSGLSVIDENSDLQSPLLSAPIRSPNFTDNELQINRINSVLASSVFPSGGDMIYYDSDVASPSDMSPGVSSMLNVPGTPMSLESSSSTLVKSPLGFPSSSSPSSPSSPAGWSPSVSQMAATRLPIGRANSTTSTASTQRTVKATKVRQHRYPKNINTKSGTSSPIESVPMQELNTFSATVSDKATIHEDHGVVKQSSHEYEDSEDVKNDERRETIVSIGASAASHATSMKTQRDSVPLMPTVENLYDFTDGYSQKSSLVPPPSARSIRTRESAFDESDIYVGIAKTVDVITKIEPDAIDRSTSPKIVGVVPARIIQPTRIGSPGSAAAGHASTLQPLYIADHTGRVDSGNSPASPASPRDPPSIRSPPSHHTDIPESAKSLVFSDEGEEAHVSHLPYETRASGYWTMFPGIGNAQENRSTKTNAATSFKSIVSYITAKSTGKGSHKSTGNRSSRWDWLLRKPLPPLPPEAQDSNSSSKVNYHTTPLSLPVPYEKSKFSPPISKAPVAWDDVKFEKRAVGGSNLMGRMFGEDSLKIAKRKPARKGTDPPQGEITPYVLPHLTGMNILRRESSVSVQPSVPRTNRRKVIIVGICAAIVILVVIISLAVVLSKKKSSPTSASCSDGNVGTFCNLATACTCPSGQSGVCTAPLAQALNDVVPQAAQIFNTNITASALAIILWEQNGTPANSSCSSQAELLDLGSGVNPSIFPNRTLWAQSALIWVLFETGSFSSTQQLQSQMLKLPFNQLTADGIVSDPAGRFAVSTTGYVLDFANQTVIAPSTTFVSDAVPPSQQLSEINPSVEGVLDRMYAFAKASSTQSQSALSQYWQNVLSLNSADLPNFLSAIRSSNIMLPFDVTASLDNNSISDFLSHANQSESFPIPIACYPGLSSSQISIINFVETQAFGLPPISSSATDFDPSCFIDRPVYGVLDIWRLRLPFPDSRKGVAQQAAILGNSGVSTRVILHAGEMLSAFPGPNETDVRSFDVNPREFGTLSHIQHVALRWLQSFPSPELAIAAATYLSQSPISPPPASSPLLNATIPMIEVALFGEVLLDTDIASFVSSFLTPSGELFFGSSQGGVFRRWALQSSSSSISIAWTNSAIAQQVIIETQSTNAKFENVWTASTKLIASGPTNSSSAQLILNTSGALGLLSS